MKQVEDALRSEDAMDASLQVEDALRKRGCDGRIPAGSTGARSTGPRDVASDDASAHRSATAQELSIEVWNGKAIERTRVRRDSRLVETGSGKSSHLAKEHERTHQSRYADITAANPLPLADRC